jgi:hypothetical protein
MNIIRGIIALILAAVALAGCSGTEGSPTAQPTTAATETDPTQLPPAEEKGTLTEEPEPVKPTPTPEPPPQPEYGEFGGAGFTYDDGITLTITAPEAFTPSEYAYTGTEWPEYIRFDITLTNGTGAPFDPSGIYGTLASGGGEAEAVFDTDNGLEGSPVTAVLPGKSVTWSEGYGVADPADLTFQIAPSFEHEAALFVLGGA